MNIAQITSAYLPSAGGGVVVVSSLSNKLANFGHNVHVYTLRGKNQKNTEFKNGVYIHRLYTPITSVGHLRFCFCNLYNDLKCFEIIHIHSIHEIFSIQAILCAIMLRKPFVVTILSAGDLLYHPSIFKRLIGAPFEKIGLFLAKYSNSIHVKTLRDKRRLVNFGFPSKRITVVPDGIPRCSFEQVGEDELRKKYNLESKRVVLYVGRIHYSKGLHVLLESIPKILLKEPDVTFLFVGPDGGMMQHLLNLAKSLGLTNYVIFTGYVSNRIKVQAYACCDVFVLPSLYDFVEAFSIVISEAWAQKKPVVASKIGCLPYRIKHGINGLLVSPGDDDELADAIIRLLEDSELCKRLGESGYKEAVTWDEVSHKVEYDYLRILDERDGKRES